MPAAEWSAPGLMAAMSHSLDVAPGMTVLEAALLAVDDGASGR
ncbi:MAG: hypothetical protein ACRDQU_08555 [Pseudonocardiaceae bacterium]